MISILVIEDETSIQSILRNFLTEAGYEVLTASDGIEGIQTFTMYNPDLILLDIMIPKIDGYGVCEFIRSTSNVPIIMLTALDDESNQVKGFDLQIDDYITKPFSRNLLMRRIDAVLRRSNALSISTIIRYKDIALDLDGFSLTLKGQTIDLTAREFEILKLFLQNQGHVYSREQILDIIWDYDYLGELKIINTHIKNIRKKIGEQYITTVRGVGYKIDREN